MPTSNATKTLLDTNVWLALALAEHPGHAAAQDWFMNLEPVSNRLLFCRATEQSVLRLLTSAKILNCLHIEALSNADAITALDAMQRQPMVSTQREPAGTQSLWLELARRPSASPQLWMDAYLAAFAISGGYAFTTFDKGFRQFEPRGLELTLLRQ